MQFFIKFQKHKGVFIVINQPNKKQALDKVIPYRNDAIAFGENEQVLTWKDAIEFPTKWASVDINWVKANANTRKKYILTVTTGEKKGQYFHEFLEEELESWCKQLAPKGNFFSISEGGPQKERFFVLPQKKKSHIPLVHIKEVKSFPIALPSSEQPSNIEESKEIKDIEVTVE